MKPSTRGNQLCASDRKQAGQERYLQKTYGKHSCKELKIILRQILFYYRWVKGKVNRKNQVYKITYKTFFCLFVFDTVGSQIQKANIWMEKEKTVGIKNIVNT